MKKKILAIDQGEHIGGAERFFSEIMTRLPDYDVHVITIGNPNYEKLYKRNSVTFHRVELPKLKPIRFTNFVRFKKAQQAIEKVIEKVKPDLIISNTVRTHLLISSLAGKTPLIWMAHDRTFPTSFLRWFIKYPQKIISCSKFVEAFYKQQNRRKELQFEVLYPFGIDVETLKSLGKTKKQKIVGMIGKFTPWKNQKVFIESADALHYLFPEYRFVIVGNTYEGNLESERYLSECEKIIRDKNLKKTVTIKKNVPNVFREIANWEVLVHCSKDPEPLGRVILEGMSAGCAVIASPFGGPCEVIQHRETGVLAKPELESLKRELRDLLNNREGREKITTSAKTHIRERYTWNNVMDLFRGLLKNKN